MLAALCEKIYQRYPHAKICLEPNHAYHYRMAYPVYQLGEVRVKGINIGALMNFAPARLRQMFGIVMPSEIDVVIDASGFGYGDNWGYQKAKNRLGDELRNNQNSKRKYVMLPQAFGPFEEPQLAQEMKHIIESVDLVFARDSVSHAHLENLSRIASLYQAPDFTNHCKPASYKYDHLAEHQVCIIPNAKMQEMKKNQDGNIYVQFMAGILKSAVDNGYNPYLLVHEGKKDAKLADEIAKTAQVEVPIVTPATAEDVKVAISKAKLVVSSRFHGLVSGLSQNIPVIATGWSHKYQTLLQSYGCENLLFDEKTQLQDAIDAMQALLSSDDLYQKTVATVTESAATEKAKTEEMWQRVYNCFEQ